MNREGAPVVWIQVRVTLVALGVGVDSERCWERSSKASILYTMLQLEWAGLQAGERSRASQSTNSLGYPSLHLGLNSVPDVVVEQSYS